MTAAGAQQVPAAAAVAPLAAAATGVAVASTAVIATSTVSCIKWLIKTTFKRYHAKRNLV